MAPRYSEKIFHRFAENYCIIIKPSWLAKVIQNRKIFIQIFAENLDGWNIHHKVIRQLISITY